VPVLIDVTVKNSKPNKPARVLDWVVPCNAEDVTSPETPTKMSFFAIKTSGGRMAKYLGAVLKHIEPEEKDYKVLKPGYEVKCTINLRKYYQFDSTSNDNSYKIKYAVTSMELSNPNASNRASALESLESNTLTVKIGAKNISTRAPISVNAMQHSKICFSKQNHWLLKQ
jgi:hypothetical protein